jgi:predicted RNase H-like nuclease
MSTAAEPKATLVAGVDGCRRGWVVVLARADTAEFQGAEMVPAFEAVLELVSRCSAVAVDIPIGLSEDLARGGRDVDRHARSLLKERMSSVFAAPPRPVLGAKSYEEALELARKHSSEGIGLSRQSFNLLKRMAEVDAAMTPALQDWVVEVHPELSFRAMNAEVPLPRSKRSAQGIVSRIRLLETAGFGEVIEQAAVLAGKLASLDDVLDACAAAWTAGRIARGEAVRIPSKPPLDRRGLRMEMWW